GARLRLGLDGRNLPAKTISPALRAFLAGQILFASRLSAALRPQAVRPAHPPPDGSQQGRTGATLFNPKGETLNHPGNRGGCLVKVKQVPQRVLQVDDSTFLRLLPAGCLRSITAGVDG